MNYYRRQPDQMYPQKAAAIKEEFDPSKINLESPWSYVAYAVAVILILLVIWLLWERFGRRRGSRSRSTVSSSRGGGMAGTRFF